MQFLNNKTIIDFFSNYWIVICVISSLYIFKCYAKYTKDKDDDRLWNIFFAPIYEPVENAIKKIFNKKFPKGEK